MSYLMFLLFRKDRVGVILLNPFDCPTGTTGVKNLQNVVVFSCSFLSKMPPPRKCPPPPPGKCPNLSFVYNRQLFPSSAVLKYLSLSGMLQFSQRKLQTELEGFTKRQFIVNTRMENLQHRNLDEKILVYLALLLEGNLEMLFPSTSR